MKKTKKQIIISLISSILLSIILSGLFYPTFFYGKNIIYFSPTASKSNYEKTEVWICEVINGVVKPKAKYNKTDWVEKKNCYVYYGNNQTKLSLVVDSSNNTSFTLGKYNYSGGITIKNDGEKKYYDLYSEKSSAIKVSLSKKIKTNYSLSNIIKFIFMFIFFTVTFFFLNLLIFSNKWTVLLKFLTVFLITMKSLDISIFKALLLFLITFFALFNFVKNQHHKKYLSYNKLEKSLLLILTFLISFMTMSIPIFMFDKNSTLIFNFNNISIYLIFTAFIFLIEDLVLTFFEVCEKKLYSSPKKFNKKNFWFYLSISFFVSLIWIISFYPGNFSPDSISQWIQAVTKNYVDSHPVLMAIILRYFYILFKTPVSFIIFQNLYFSIMIATIFSYLEKKGAKRIVLLILAFIIPFIPNIGMTNVTLWKDIIYSISLIFLSYYCYRIVVKDMDNFYSIPNVLLFIFSFITVRGFRHNGIAPFVFIIILMSYYVLKRRDKKLLILLIISTIFTIFVINGLYKFNEIKKVDLSGSKYNSIAKNFIATVYYEKDLSSKAHKFIDEIGDTKYFKENYDPYNIDYLFYNSTDSVTRWFNVVNNYKLKEVLPEYLKNIYKNPDVFIKDRFSGMAIMLDSSFTQTRSFYGKYYYHYGISLPSSEKGRKIFREFVDFKEKEYYYPNNKLSKVMMTYLDFSTKDEIFILFFWKSGLFFALFLLLLYYKFLKKDLKIWLGLIPIIANTLTWVVALNHPSVRYVYYLNVAFIFYLLLFLIPKERRKSV